MRRYLSIVLLSCVGVLSFSSCSHSPEHVRYIPKDAVVVVGINASSLTKKVAWNVITGSKLFKQWMNDLHEKSAGSFDVGKLGIDNMNTVYLYIKGDKRYKDGSRVTALVPLSSASDWEAYIKKQLPNINIAQHGERKETMLTEGMYAGWNSKLLVIMNVLPGQELMQGPDTAQANARPKMDDAALSAEMDNAFGVTKENALMGNEHFATLQKEDHDVMFWMNYDILMSEYVKDGLSSKMEGVSLTNTLWKDAAFAGGIDFEKGSIKGGVKYYTSKDMVESSRDMGSTNADKDMLERLPTQNLDVLAAWHLSPKGLKGMLEKAGLLGFANIALGQQGISSDFIFDAFTGDMALDLSDFSLKNETITDTSFWETMTSSSLKPSLNAMYVAKINKKENFEKLLKMVAEGAMMSIGPNSYAMPISDKDSLYVVTSGDYAIAANKMANIKAYMDGSNKSQKVPGAVSANVYGHPFALYLDIQQMAKTIDPGLSHSSHDSAVIVEAKRLLDNVAISGGEYKNNAFEYHMTINFMNKDENSLLEIMDFGMRVNDINNSPAPSAYNTNSNNFVRNK